MNDTSNLDLPHAGSDNPTVVTVRLAVGDGWPIVEASANAEQVFGALGRRLREPDTCLADLVTQMDRLRLDTELAAVARGERQVAGPVEVRLNLDGSDGPAMTVLLLPQNDTAGEINTITSLWYQSAQPAQGATSAFGGLIAMDALLKQMHDGVFLVRNARIIFCNQMVAHLLGTTPDALDGTPIAELIAPQDREQVLQRYAQRQKGEPVPTQYKFDLLRRSDQALVPVLMSVGIIEMPNGVKLTLGTLRDITDLEQARKELERNQERYLRLSDLSTEGLIITENKVISDVNAAMTRLLGYPRDELTGRPPARFFMNEEDSADIFGDLTAGSATFTANMMRKDGSDFPAKVDIRDVTLDGLATRVLTISDITAERAYLQQIKESNREIQLMVKNLPDAFFGIDLDGNIGMVSPYTETLTGYSKAELTSMNVFDLYVNPNAKRRLLDALKTGSGRTENFEVDLRRKDGQIIWLLNNAYTIYDADGEPVGIQGIGRDITARKRTEEELRYMAGHDPLTGLLNRIGFGQHLKLAILRAHRHSTSLSLLFLDLDGFKAINDTHGHHIGDLVLKEVGNRLNSLLRRTDSAARAGGDEFTIILEGSPAVAGIKREQTPEVVAAKILKSIATVYEIEGHSLSISTSIGIANYPQDGTDSESLLRSADGAMYDAKENGKNTYCMADRSAKRPQG